MSKRGRPPKPRTIKIDEAKGAPSCPNCLGKEGRREWKRVTQELLALNLLSRADRAALTAYCEAWEEFIKLVTHVRKEGPVVFTSKGTAVQNPTLGAKNKAADRLVSTAAQFGMTPAARAKIEIAEKKPSGKLAKFITRSIS